MWYLVIFIIVLLFISTSNQKTEKTEKTGKTGQIEKAEPYERRLALNKAELEENIKNKEKYENILLKLRKKMAIKELSDKEIEEIDNKISYAKECINFFETKIILIQDKIDNSLRKEIEERNPQYQKLSPKKEYKKIEEEHKKLVNYYQQKVSPEKEKIIKLYQQILENE